MTLGVESALTLQAAFADINIAKGSSVYYCLDLYVDTFSWFKTEPPIGYGVTATSRFEAEQFLGRYGYPLPGQRVIEVIKNLDFSSLDGNHVLPNSGPIVVRGVWFPCHNV
jgi:hypothetical protein